MPRADIEGPFYPPTAPRRTRVDLVPTPAIPGEGIIPQSRRPKRARALLSVFGQVLWIKSAFGESV